MLLEYGFDIQACKFIKNNVITIKKNIFVTFPCMFFHMGLIH